MIRRYAEGNDELRHIWDVEKIWKLAENLEVIEISIDSIEGIDSVTWFNDQNQPTIRSIAEHARRIIEADTAYPPILTESYRVFDGMHRIAKHLMEGKTTIKVKKFKKNPEPDEIQDNRVRK